MYFDSFGNLRPPKELERYLANSVIARLNMSLMLTLTGKSSVLAMSYFLAVDLGDGDYKLSLTDFEMYYTLANVNSINKFYYGNEEIVIPEESNYMI